MPDVARLRRLLAGTVLVEGPPPDDDEARAAARRAWMAQWWAARPLPPPLDRLSPDALAALRAGRPLRKAR